MALKYLLWDHDGVLVDTEQWYFEATRSVLAQAGVSLAKEQYLEFMAVGRSSWHLASALGVSEQGIRDLRNERDALYQKFLRTKPIEIENVAATLAMLAPRYRMAIVTTARRVDFDLIHAHRDLRQYFEFILTVEDYPRPKPEPDPYLAGLARFGARADEAIVLEDSARGLGSAQNAGIRCIVIRNPFTASQNFTPAWRVVDSIQDVPAALLSHTP